MTDRRAIKPLEWTGRESWKWAKTPFGDIYTLRPCTATKFLGKWLLSLGVERIGELHDSEEVAQEAAQADYASRIRSCLLDKPEAGEGEEDLLSYYERQIEWSRQTFGPALRTKGVIDHIRKELREIEQDPHDLSEWVDVVILAMDGFWRHGGNASDLFPALLAKQKKNMARTWPDWRTMSEDKAIEHDRAKDAPEMAARQEECDYHRAAKADFQGHVDYLKRAREWE
ncbi:DUF550 domain-containing protein [Sinorhizobium meliloti]|nr:DUF550 domain-containing protein [Sinorhizobium meliloti]